MVTKRATRTWAEARADAARAPEDARCWLCGRELGRRVEWHHPVPKSRGGTVTQPVHPICHRALHANLSNKELEAFGMDLAALRSDPRVAPFLRWVAGRPADFNAPTRRRKA